MKRLLTLLSGALMGVIVLLFVRWLCVEAVLFLFPRFFLGFFYGLPPDWGEPAMLVSGVVLGALSWVLWRGERSLLVRVASVVCSVAAIVLSGYRLKEDREYPGHSFNFMLVEVAWCAPLILWALALFFFAVLARRKPLHP